jgi:short-subunit dehydrogenase
MSKQVEFGTALITGASTGIGAVYADRLARRGYDLILVARDLKRLDELAAKISKETGRTVHPVQADLTKPDDLRAIEKRLGTDATIEMLVNNAGLGATKTLVDSSPEDLDRMILLNVLALTRLTRAVAPQFVERRRGTIINIASIVAVAPELLNGTYGGTKAYVLALTQALHHELSASGVRVQAVLPGAISTPFWDKAGMAVENLPNEIVMNPDDLVDAALAGLDQHELVTVPSLPDQSDWNSFESARLALGPKLSRKKPAERYHISSATRAVARKS